MQFQAVEHRMNLAAVHGSNTTTIQATNVDATIKALESFRDIHSSWAVKTRQRLYATQSSSPRTVKQVNTIGAAAEKIESQIGDAAKISMRDVAEAVKQLPSAQSGDVCYWSAARVSIVPHYQHRDRCLDRFITA